jgi:hypothetical protein
VVETARVSSLIFAMVAGVLIYVQARLPAHHPADSQTMIP